MSFAGHVLDMINRMKYNASIKQSRRDRYEAIKEAYNQKQIRRNKFTDWNKLPKDDLKVLKAKIRRRMIYERRKSLIFSIIITTLILIGILISLTNTNIE